MVLGVVLARRISGAFDGAEKKIELFIRCSKGSFEQNQEYIFSTLENIKYKVEFVGVAVKGI